MEAKEGCRVTRQATKKSLEPVASPKKEKPSVVPEPKPKRKRKTDSNSASTRPSRKSRSMNSKDSESTEVKVDNGNEELKQSSWSSGFSLTDDEDLPPVVLNSPSKSNGKRTYKKFDIVWIKHRKDVYRPCLITKVYKDHVSYKFVNETRKYTWNAKFGKIIPFDNPDKNIELLNEGRKISPRVVDAFDRVKHYLCRLSEQENLSPLKYLLPSRTEDLLYGIIPELERTEGEDPADSEEEFERPVLDTDCDSDENSDKEDKEEDVEIPKEDDRPEEKSVYDKISNEDKAKISVKIKALLDIIQSEDCFNYLKQLVEEPGENSRMKLLSEKDEALLMYQSGLGPFFVAEKLETDKLSDILEEFTKKMDFRGDVSLLHRHVLTPEAIIFALQKLCQLEREPAETFFLRWTHEIPEWIET